MMNEAASEKVIELLVQQKRELRIQRDQLIESIRERQIERDEARVLARQYLNDLHALGAPHRSGLVAMGGVKNV